MTRLVWVVAGLMFVWTLVAVTETAGIPILPRETISLHLATR
ncbi:MAG TPA: hypothetical protein VGV37_26855 [Aliidongia sp.]|nr:hypothetical protein [Aliidongia sp.]HEV2678176.1 hypothetical protein [Aliidongia sp.]